MNTQEEFEKLWNPICPEYDSISSSHVFKFYEACQALNDKRIAELEEKRIMQLSAISTASIGYFKDGETIHSDYDTTALRDVTNLYAKVAELEEKLRVAEVDAERLRILMNMSGEYYAESVKHQFVGRLQEFIDRHANEVSQAINEASEALKTIEG